MNSTPERKDEWSWQINKAIEQLFGPISQPVGAVAQNLGTSLATALGAQDPTKWGNIIGQAGAGLPRLGAQAALTRFGLPGMATAVADTALQSYATAPTELEGLSRLGYAALPAAAFAVAPKLAETLGGSVGPAGVKGVAPLVSRPVGNMVEDALGSTAGRLAEKGIEKSASLAGMLGAFEAAKAGQGAIAGQPYGLSEALSPENLVSTAATVLPFELLGLGQLVRGYKPTENGYVPAGLMDLFAPKQPGQVHTLADVARVEDVLKPALMTLKREQDPGLKQLVVNDANPPVDVSKYLQDEVFTTQLVAKDPNLAEKVQTKTLTADDLTQAFKLYPELAPKAATVEPPQLTFEVKQHLDSLEQLGWEPNELASVVDKLSQPIEPKQLFSDVAGLLQRVTDDLGMTGDRKRIWLEAGQALVHRIAPTLGKTRAVELREGTGVGGVSGGATQDTNPFLGITITRGLPEDMAMNEVFYKLGHEVYHSLEHQLIAQEVSNWSPRMIEAYKAIVRDVDQLDQPAMVNAMQQLLKPFGTLGGEQLARYTPDTKGRSEFLADSFGVFSLGLVQGRSTGLFANVRDTIRFGDANTRQLITAMVKDLGAVVQRMLITGKNLLGLRLNTKERLMEIQRNLESLAATARDADKATEAFLRHFDIINAKPWNPADAIDYTAVERLYRDGYDPELKQLVGELAQDIVPQERKPVRYEKRLGIFDYLKPIAQLTREWPALMSSWRLARGYNGAVSSATMQMWDRLVDPKTGKFDVEGFQRLKQDGSPVNVAFSKIALKQQELTKEREGQLLWPREMEAIPEYARLSPQDKEFIQRKQIQIADAVMRAANLRVDAVRINLGHAVAKVLMTHDPQMKWELAEELGHALTTLNIDHDMLAAVAQRPQDLPELAQRVQEANESLAKYGNPAVLERGRGVLVNRATQKPTGAVNAYTEIRNKMLGKFGFNDELQHFGFAGKPGYMPEVRLGRFAITFTEADGTPHYEGFKDKASFQKRLDALNPGWMRGELKSLKWFDKENQEDAARGLRPDMWGAFQEAETQLYNAVLAEMNQAHPEAQELLAELKSQYRPGEAAAALTEPPYMRERRLVAGREKLNMPEGFVHYVNSTAWQTAKLFARGQRSLILLDPELRANPQLRQVARKYLSEIIDSTEAELGPLKNMAALNYLFFNPSQAFVEMTQQFTTHVPALINQGVAPSKAYQMALTSLNDLYKAWRRGDREGSKQSVFDNPEETRAMQEAVQRRVVDAGWLSEVFHLEDDVQFVNSSNILAGSGQVLTREGLVGKPLYHLFQMGRKGYSWAISMNTRAAFLSSFRLFRQQGKGYDEAFKLATDLTQESMFGGGRAARPLWFLGIGKGGNSTIGGVMYMLQSYTYNAMAQMARYLKQAITNSNLSPAGRYAAGQAAGTALATNVLLAGVSGIPLSAAAFALIEQLFPQVEPRRKLREYLFGVGESLNKATGFLEDDKALGEFLSRAGLDGVVNTGPINLASRFSLGGILGVNPNSGFSWENLIGPGTGLFDKIGKAIGQLAAGNGKQFAIEAIPNNPIQRLARLASDGWDLRNREGKLQVELSQNEAMLYAAGFTPKRVADYRTLDALQRRAESALAYDQKQFHTRMAEALLEGKDPQEVRQQLLARRAQVEHYDPIAGAQAVAELVLARVIPSDPSREFSTVGGAYKVSHTLGGPLSRTSEQDRLVQRTTVINALGFPAKLSQSSLAKALRVDKQREVDEATRPEVLAHLPSRRRVMIQGLQ